MKEEFINNLNDKILTPFYYKGKRTFNLESGQQEVETFEGFFLEEVVDFALGKLPNDEKEQLIVRLKNKEDKDTPKQIPIFGKDNKVTKVETKLVRRDENSVHIIEDVDAIYRWKELFGIVQEPQILEKKV